jgi:hypothetical protein
VGVFTVERSTQQVVVIRQGASAIIRVPRDLGASSTKQSNYRRRTYDDKTTGYTLCTIGKHIRLFSTRGDVRLPWWQS